MDTAGNSTVVTELIVRAQEFVSGAFGKVGEALDSAGQKARSVAQQLQDVARQTATLAIGIGGIGAAVAGFSLHAAMGFETAIVHVKAFAASGEAARAAVDQMSGAILNMAPALGLSATKMAEGLYSIESAGIAGADSMIALKAASNAAAASQTDLGVVTDALTSVINAYGLKGQQITEAQNQMTLAVLRGKMEFRDFAASIGQVVPIAAQQHVSIAQLGAAYELLTNQGNDAAESSVLLRNVIESLSAPTRNQVKAAEGMKLSAHDLTIQNGDLAATLVRIQSALGGSLPNWREYQQLTGVSRQQAILHTEALFTENQAVRALFGGNQTAMRGFFALMVDGGKTYQDAVKGMSSADAAAQDALKEAFKSTQHQMDVFRASVEVLGIRIGQTLLPAFNDIVKAMVPLVQSLANFAGKNPEIVRAALAIALAIGAIGVAARGVTFTIAPIIGMMTGFGNGFLYLRGAVSGAGESIGATAAAAVAAEPELASLGGVAGGVTATGFQKWAASMLTAEELMGALDAELAATTTGIAAEGVAADASAVSTGLLDAALGILLSPVVLIVAAIAALAAGFIFAWNNCDPFREAIENLGSALETKLQGAFQLVIIVVKDVIGWFGDLGAKLGQLGSAIGDFFTRIKGPMDALGGFLGNIAQGMGITAVANAVSGAAGATGSALDHLAQTSHKTTDDLLNDGSRLREMRIQARTHLEAVAQAARDSAAVQIQTSRAVAQAVTTDVQTIIDKQEQLRKSNAASFSPGLGAGTPALQQAQASLPADFRAAFQPVIDDFAKQYGALQTSYLAGLSKENNKYQQQMSGENAHFVTAYAAAGEAQRIKLVQTFQDHIANLRKTHDDNVIALQTTFSDGAQKIKEAILAMNTPAGIWDALDKSVKKIANDDMAALSLALLRGTGNVDGLTAAAIRSAEKLDLMAAKTVDATNRVQRGRGDYTGTVSSEQAGLQKGLSEATARLTYDLEHHRSSVAADRVAVDTARGALDHFTTIQKQAADSGVSVKKSFDDLSKAAKDRASSALDALALGIMRGDSPGQLAGLARTATAAKLEADSWSKALKRAGDMISSSTKSASDALKGLADRANTQLNNALATAAEHIRLHGSATRAEIEDIQRASRSVNEFSDSMNRAKRYETPDVKPTFAGRESGAQAKLANDMDKLDASFLRGHVSHTALVDAVDKDREAVHRYTEAHNAAILAVAQKTGDWVTIFDAMKRKVETAVTTSFDRLAVAINTGHGNITKFVEQAARAQLAADHLARSQEQATQRIDAATGNWSGVLDGMKKQIDTAASTAVDHLTVAIMRGSGGLGHLADVAAAAEAKVKRFADAQADAALRVAKASGDWVTVLSLQAARNTQAYDQALAAIQESISLHGHATRTELAALQKAADQREKISSDQAQAATLSAQADIRAAAKAGDLATEFDKTKNLLSSQLNTALSRAAQEWLNTGSISAKTAQQIENLGDQTERNNQAMKVAADVETAGLLRAAKASGDLATVFDRTKSDISTKLATATSEAAGEILQFGHVLPATIASLQGLTQASIANAAAEKQAQAVVTQATLDAARSAGDFATVLSMTKTQVQSDLSNAFDALQGAILAGVTDLSSLTDTYEKAKAAADALTQSEIAADQATGQWSAAWSKMTSDLSQKLGDATDKLANDFLTNSDSIAEDTANVKALQDQQKAYAAAQWDAAFATADLTTQTQMLTQKFSGLISQQSTVQGAQSAVDSAQLGVIATQSAVAVQEITIQTTAIQGMASIISATSAVQTAAFNGQLAAINDSTTIMKDLDAIQRATSPQQLAVATAQLRVDQLTAAENRARAAWDIKIAQDGQRTAVNKMNMDMANARAQQVVLMDQLAVAMDAVVQAKAQQKLTLDTMAILNDIDSNLGAVQDFGSMVSDDLNALQQAQDQTRIDQERSARDQAAAAQQAAEGQLQAAIDATQSATDTAGATAANQQYELRIAEAKKALEVANLQLSATQNNTNAVNNNTATGQQQLAELQKANANLVQQLALMTRAAFLGRITGLGRIDVSGMSFGQWNSALATASWAQGGMR